MESSWVTGASCVRCPVVGSSRSNPRTLKLQFFVVIDGVRRELDLDALMLPSKAQRVAISKFHGSFAAMSKSSLAKNLMLLQLLCKRMGLCEMAQSRARDFRLDSLFAGVPRTWVLPADRRKVAKELALLEGGPHASGLSVGGGRAMDRRDCRLVLVKPDNLNQGRGISLHNAAALSLRISRSSSSSSASSTLPRLSSSDGLASPSLASRAQKVSARAQEPEVEVFLGTAQDPVVVQEYIEPPLCVGGFKVDLRLYLIIDGLGGESGIQGTIEPLSSPAGRRNTLELPRLFLARQGLVRASTVPYQNHHHHRGGGGGGGGGGDSSLAMHLTNFSLHKKDGAFVRPDPKGETGHKRSLSSLWRDLASPTPHTRGGGGGGGGGGSSGSGCYGEGMGLSDDELELLWRRICILVAQAAYALVPPLRRHQRRAQALDRQRSRQRQDQRRPQQQHKQQQQQQQPPRRHSREEPPSPSPSSSAVGGQRPVAVHHFQVVGVDILLRDGRKEGQRAGRRRGGSKERDIGGSQASHDAEATSPRCSLTPHLLEVNCNPSLSATDEHGATSPLDAAVKGRVAAAAVALAALRLQKGHAQANGNNDSTAPAASAVAVGAAVAGMTARGLAQESSGSVQDWREGAGAADDGGSAATTAAGEEEEEEERQRRSVAEAFDLEDVTHAAGTRVEEACAVLDAAFRAFDEAVWVEQEGREGRGDEEAASFAAEALSHGRGGGGGGGGRGGGGGGGTVASNGRPHPLSARRSTHSWRRSSSSCFGAALREKAAGGDRSVLGPAAAEVAMKALGLKQAPPPPPSSPPRSSSSSSASVAAAATVTSEGTPPPRDHGPRAPPEGNATPSQEPPASSFSMPSPSALPALGSSPRPRPSATNPRPSQPPSEAPGPSQPREEERGTIFRRRASNNSRERRRGVCTRQQRPEESQSPFTAHQFALQVINRLFPDKQGA